MFYKPSEGHGLAHNPFNAIVTPRPIGWVSTRGRTGDNLAPYSFFNAVAYIPPQVMVASTGTKDTTSNLSDSGCFAVNVVEFAQRDAMNATAASFDRDVDEFEAVGVAKAECNQIDCPRIAGAPAVLECRVTQVVRLEGADNHAVFGEVVGIHLRDDCVLDGRFDVTRFAPLARLGYRDYAVVREVFELRRPGE